MMRVSFTQFWRAANELGIHKGNRKDRRMAARKDWPKYKNGRNGAEIDTTSVHEFVEANIHKT